MAVRGWLRTHPEPLGVKLGATARSVKTAKDADGTALYHVVSLAPDGFVICSADTAIEPILAFSASGRFEADPENPLYALIERDARGRMDRVRDLFTRTTADTSRSMASSKWSILQDSADGLVAPKSSRLASMDDPRVDPFIQSRWNQGAVQGGACYNYYTPPYAAGSVSNYFCGCNSTAWGQLMRYFRYPTRPVGTASFSIRVDGVSTHRRLRGGDGSGGPYAWDLMPLVPTDPTPAERQAIGALCADIGVASGTSYASGGSSAGTSEQTLKNVFFYSNICYVSGPSHLAEAVRPNLDARLPVVLGIWGDDGGHAVLCDGYGFNLSSPYYHLNMGWGGQKDAWYNLPDVDTDWYQFDTLRSIQCNIYTNGTGEILSGRVLAGGTPVAGAEVEATGGGQTYRAVTDARGIYALTRLPSDTEYVLTVAKDGLQFEPLAAATGLSPSWSTSTGNSWSNDLSGLSTGSMALAVTPGFREVASPDGTVIFTIANTGGGTMEFAASETESWLSVTGGDSGTNGGTLSVSYLSNPGTTARTGTVRVTAPGANGSPTAVRIIQAGRPILTVSPASRTVGSAAGTTIFTVTNTGDGTMDYAAGESISWLSIAAGASGTDAGALAIAVAANPGTTARTGTVTVTAPDASGSPRLVTVVQAGMTIYADAYEPDHSASAAKPIANGQTQSRNIHAAGNVDWVKFTVGGAGARNLTLLTAGATGDTQVWLYRSSGMLVAYDDDSGAGTFSRIAAASLPPGTYYVKVQEFGNNGAIPAYTLRASWTTVIAADAYEPDASASAARWIANGQTQYRSLHAAGNVDWVKFAVGGRGALNLRMESSGASGDTQMWLYSSSGKALRYDDNSGPGNFSLITAAFLTPGTYFIKIQESGNNGTIPAYTLRANWTARR